MHISAVWGVWVWRGGGWRTREVGISAACTHPGVLPFPSNLGFGKQQYNFQGDEKAILLSITSSGDFEGEVVGEEAKVEVGEVTGEELANMVTLIRVRGYLEVNCGMTQQEVGNAFRHLIEKVSCPYGSFKLEGDRLVFLHKFIEKSPGRGWTSTVEQKEEEDCLIAGLEDPDVKVGDLWGFTQAEEESDGFGGSSKKPEIKPKEVLEFQFIWNYTNPACSSRTIGCAPILHRERKSGSTVGSQSFITSQSDLE